MIITNNGTGPSHQKSSMQEIKSKSVIKSGSNLPQGTNIILNIFHYTWFIDRVQEESDLFRC